MTLRDAYIRNFYLMCCQYEGSSDHEGARDYLDNLDRQSEAEYGEDNS